MELNDAIFGRRATRQYTRQAVETAMLQKLLVSAVNAPSAVNGQPWGFTVVRDQVKLDLISRSAKSHMLATVPGAALPGHVHGPLADASFQIFYHAPALILISATQKGPWVVEDCALAAENLMLAAYGAGLGSCWIGLAQSWLNTPEGKKVLDTPDAWISVAPIIVGYAQGLSAPVPRREPLVRWIDAPQGQ